MHGPLLPYTLPVDFLLLLNSYQASDTAPLPTKPHSALNTAPLLTVPNSKATPYQEVHTLLHHEITRPMVTRVSFIAVAAVLLLRLLPHAFAHGDGDGGHRHGDMALPVGASMASDLNSSIGNSMSPAPESYFAYPHLSGFMVAHIVLMTIAWLFILPISELTS